MDVMKKLIRLLQDDYKVGVEMRSRKAPLYLNPDTFDLERLQNDIKRDDKKAIASQISEKMDEQFPGLSKKFTQEELLALTHRTLTAGPNAVTINDKNSGVCIITEPKASEITRSTLYSAVGISKVFDSKILTSLPGSNAEWRQLVGEHEGEHCNQENPLATDSDIRVKILDQETRSDLVAIESLRKEGREDVITAWKALRAIAAGSGDETHGTSIFFDDPDFKGVTAEHLAASENFRQEMNMGVAAHLGITAGSAETLRTEDPQKYARSAQAALNDGTIPAVRDMPAMLIKKMIVEKLGIEEADLYNLSKPRNDIIDAYKEVKKDTGLKYRGPENPHVNKYIQNYIDATGVLFVKDTTPSLTSAASPPKVKNEVALPPQPTAEEVALKKQLDLQEDAKSEVDVVIDDMVKKALKIDDEHLAELLENDPDKYFAVAEQELRKGKFPSQTTGHKTYEETDELIAQKLGIQSEELTKQPYLILNAVRGVLKSEGALEFKQDNPYLKQAIEERIQDYKKPKIELEVPQEDKPSAEAAPAPVASASGGKYDYLIADKKDDGNGVPKVDLRGNDKAEMKIGCMSACEYFATKANPVLATNITPAPGVGVEISDPTLTKVAQNKSPYITTGTGMA